MLNAVTAAGVGDTLTVVHDQEIRWEAQLIGTGAVSAQWLIEFVNGGGDWQTWRTEGLEGTDEVAGAGRWRSPGTQLRANLLSITGTDAALSVTAYTSHGPVQPIVSRAAASGIRAADNGRTIVTSDAQAASLNVIAPINKGFVCSVIQGDAGAITIAGTNVTVHNRQSHTDTAGQYAKVVLTATADDVVVLSGDTAAGA